MKKNTNIFKKITVATILATLLVTIPPTTYAQTGLASALAVQMVNTSYSTTGISEPTDFKIWFNSVDQTSKLQNPIIIMNGRSLVPIRDLGNILGAEVSWDTNKIAIIKRGSVTIEVPIGSKNILINGKATPIDSQNPISAVIYKERTYLPFRIIAEALNHKVDYKVQDGYKNILIDSTLPTNQQQPQPVPEQGEYTHELGVIPEQYKNTTYAKVYNSLRRAGKLTEEHAKIVMASIKSFSPLNEIEADEYRCAIKRSKEDGYLRQNIPDPNRKGEWYMQPAGSDYPGWYWNGNNWNFNFGVYYGTGQ